MNDFEILVVVGLGVLALLWVINTHLLERVSRRVDDLLDARQAPKKNGVKYPFTRRDDLR